MKIAKVSAGIASACGVLIALGLLGVSSVMNWRYGMSLGREPIDRYAYALTHVLGDALKAAVPFYWCWSIKNREWLVAGASLLLWVLCTSYSVSSLLGYADLNRQTAAGVLAGKADGFADLRRELEHKQKRLASLGAQDAVGAIERQLEGARRNLKWTASKQCTDARGDAKTFCAEYSTVEATLARAQQAERLDEEIAALQLRLAGLSGAAKVDRSGDPQAGAVVRLTGWELVKVQTGLSLLLVAVLEFGSSFGLFVALNHGELKRGSPTVSSSRDDEKPLLTIERETAKSGEAIPSSPIGSVEAFALARLKEMPGKSVPVDVLFRSFVGWCKSNGRTAIARAEFDDGLQAVAERCTASGNSMRLERSGNRVYCRNRQLAA